MNRPTLYFRLSLVWLVILAGNRRNREVGRRREGGGWVCSSDEAEQCPRSEGALPFAMSPT
jgi:hypothetical protein